MRELRKLVLGETWSVPLGVAAVLLVAALAQALAPGWWSGAGGLVLLLLVIAVLVLSVARGARPRE